MGAMFNFPEAKVLVYLLNPLTGRFEKQPDRIVFQKLPFDLKVETTQKDFLKQQGAQEIITGRFKNKVREFFTGLIPVPSITNWYFGNDYEIVKGVKKYSLILFNFHSDNRTLTVYYFNRWYKDSRAERIQFIQSFINHTNGKRSG